MAATCKQTSKWSKIIAILGDIDDENAMTGTDFIFYLIDNNVFKSMVEKTNPNDV